MLNDFFRINLPYGIVKNEKGEWMAFNREYMPLGFNNYEFREKSNLDLPIYTKYKNLTPKLLKEIAHENGIHYDENGEITKVFLYNDGSNPRNQSKEKKEVWDSYFEKLKKLSKLQVS